MPKKNIMIHFSPYLRCCETADLIITHLQEQLAVKAPDLKPKFLLLGDFALSEWCHEKMENKPPFYDSNEAYQMYTPNIQMMKNRKFVLNFRPTTKLGPWNEPDISHKQFQEHCKLYFQKLLATYQNAKSDTVVIVVAHGYVISSFLLHFISHPIFQEIPELGVNFAVKTDGNWVLKKDCLGILAKKPSMDSTLNLDSDIVYYKTNFVKKGDLDTQQEFPAMGFGGLLRPHTDDAKERPSFRYDNKASPDHPVRPPPVPLCPAAKNWNPLDSNKHRIALEFRLKVMNDEAFKRTFSIVHAPQHPISPDVSPTSEPSGFNSTIDLSKLASNEEIYHPLKLRYSSTSSIPIHHLNSKVNSHASLINMRTDDEKSMDLGRLQLLSGLSTNGSMSPRDQLEDYNEHSPNMNDVILRLNRVRSLQRKRPQTSTPKFGPISEKGSPSSDKGFMHFNDDQLVESTPPGPAMPVRSATGTRLLRSSSFKFVPSVLDKDKKKKPIFYQLHSSSGTDSSDDESADLKYMWFGQNVRSDKS